MKMSIQRTAVAFSGAGQMCCAAIVCLTAVLGITFSVGAEDYEVIYLGSADGGIAGVPETSTCDAGEVHDDGSTESGFLASGDTVFVELFTPGIYPFQYTRVCVCFGSFDDEPDLNLRIVFYDDDGPGGEPETLLASVPVTTVGMTDIPQFFDFDISSSGVVISSGSVYIGVQWDGTIDPLTFNCVDSTPSTPQQVGYFSDDAGSTWTNLESASPDAYQALIVRADGEQVGACCLPDGMCIDGVMLDECNAQSGVYQGLGVMCADVRCEGACCLTDGDCADSQTPAECDAQSGTYQGLLSECLSVVCPAGACCFSDGSCTSPLSPLGCDLAGGQFAGDMTDCATFTCQPFTDRVSGTEKGSLLMYSKVEVRFDGAGNLVQDTFIHISNDYNEDVRVKMYLVNGDEPWDYLDNQIILTANEPAYWSASTGDPKGVSPITALGPPIPDPEGSGDFIKRGFLVAFAVDMAGQEIRWNHLTGGAVLVDYRQGFAWEYNAWSFGVVDILISHGQQTGTPGVIMLNGMEYAKPYGHLLIDFYAVGSAALSSPSVQAIAMTDLTLHPVRLDVRQETEGPVLTKAEFNVWNEDETKFTGMDRCILCWDQTLLSNYEAPNHFLLRNLQTDKGKARIDGVKSAVHCDIDINPLDGACGAHPDDICSEKGPLLGVIARFLAIGGGRLRAASGTNPIGLSTEDAEIRFDTQPLPEESTDPTTSKGWYDSIKKKLERRGEKNP